MNDKMGCKTKIGIAGQDAHCALSTRFGSFALIGVASSASFEVELPASEGRARRPWPSLAIMALSRFTD